MRLIISAILILLVANALWANDTTIQGVSGTVTPLAGEHASIRMVNETVRMDIYPQYYDVQAEFLFHNTGKATTVTMGFPETGAGDGYAKFENNSAFHYFRTTFDGKPVVAIRQLDQAHEKKSYLAWWKKEVSFAAGEQRRVTVSYRAPLGDVEWGAQRALYHFTGGNWTGTVGESRLHINLHLNGTYAVQSSVPLVQTPDGWSAIWHDWEAEETATITFQRCGDWDMALRGLDIPREEDNFNWLSPRMQILHLRTPGVTNADSSIFLPPAFVNTVGDGRVYVSERAVREFIATRCPDIPAPQLSWDTETHEAMFSFLGETLRFYVFEDPKMDYVGDGFIGIVRTKPAMGMAAGHTYMPADALYNAFGLRDDVSYDDHFLKLTFPTPKSNLFAYKGKTYHIQGDSIVEAMSGKVVAKWAKPTPTKIAPTVFPVKSTPYTIGTHLLLPYGEDGMPELYIYDLANGVETGMAKITDTLLMSTYTTLVPADQRYLYRFVSDEKTTLSVEKYSLAEGKAVWQRELPGLSSANHFDFIAEQDGDVALYSARRKGEGIIDPAEVILLNAENGTLRTRYYCSLDDATAERLPRWTAELAEIRALLNIDGQLLAASYGQGLWRSDNGKTWTNITYNNVPTYLVSLAASRNGDIAAGSWMEEGLAFRSPLDAEFRLLAWPNQPEWPKWWSREYSRNMAVGYCGDTLYVQSWGGFLRWTANAGWERTTIPVNVQTNALINDSGIWTAVSEGEKLRIRHYNPAGVSDLDVSLATRVTAITAITAFQGMLYLFAADASFITCTASDLRKYAAAATAKERIYPSWWSPTTAFYLLPYRAYGPDRTIRAGDAVMIYPEAGNSPIIIAGTSMGPVFSQKTVGEYVSTTLDPALKTYDSAFTSYRDSSGEWLVMGGKDGVVMLPASVISASLFAASALQR